MKTRPIIAAVASIVVASFAVSAPTFANFISGVDSQSDRRDAERALIEATLVVEEVRFRGAAAPTTTAPAAPTTTAPAAPAAPTTTAPAAPTTTAPTTTAPAAPTTTAPAVSCLESAISTATSLLRPYGIPVPSFGVDPNTSHKAYYQVGGGIYIQDCVSDSIIAHELGHYIHFLSVGSNWSAMKADSLNFCLGQDPSTGRCEGGWLSDNGKKSEASAAPGVEHAAHCIGNQLGVSGSYSKCPDAALASSAQARIANA